MRTAPVGLNQDCIENILRCLRSQHPVNPGMSDGGFASLPSLSPSSLDFSIHILEQVSSTNETLWTLLAAGAPPGTVVIATRQTAGKGQRGRQWDSSPGGLYLSLALTPNLNARDALLLTLCSAWGLATTLRAYNIPVSLKWPNDLILEGYKLGGILTETKIHQGQITKAVVGVGINWSNPVPETGINLQTFLGDRPDPGITSLEMLAALTLWAVASGYQTFNEKGVGTLLPSYQNLMVGIGQPLAVEGSAGIVLGVSNTGELRVRLNRSPVPDPNCTFTSASTTEEIELMPGTINQGYPILRA
ncbi:biotin--[acetyl-CoA-carboxylase] ligase [Laspinema olomoucense]|uniref:Biotin--[acetyl-CoA-carboxylase] ligase n=1 Tax=Laspinema olomoucense D3b TaxID=2953688 RepID=A0ABT2N895_9CYAN|nr:MULTISPECIES: biotin--[acetyl-CoA-carboxylase] ligase [unclassified Laspinema]MCT7977481.1 biotin--[acetyl-CoA-carboxylase] ligase [Laspinema sp. D3b]MCT7986895.1 biotin--[acetyl-CoA-carboxylase] ligase [Laspinema sp. D3a]